MLDTHSMLSFWDKFSAHCILSLQSTTFLLPWLGHARRLATGHNSTLDTTLIQTATPMVVVGLGGVDAGEPDTCK